MAVVDLTALQEQESSPIDLTEMQGEPIDLSVQQDVSRETFIPEAKGDEYYKDLAKQSFNRYWSEKKQLMQDPYRSNLRKAGTVAWTGIEGLGYAWDKATEPVIAAISAKQLGEDPWMAYKEELFGGEKKRADILSGWEPDTLGGQLAKGVVNIGARIVGPGGAVKGGGKLLQAAGKASKLKPIAAAGKTIEKVGKGIQAIENAPNIIAKPALAPVGKIAGKIPKVIHEAAKESPGIRKFARAFVSPRMGVADDILDGVDDFQKTSSVIQGRVSAAMQKLQEKITAGKDISAKGMIDTEIGQMMLNRKSLRKLGMLDDMDSQILTGSLDDMNDAIKDISAGIKNKINIAGKNNGMSDDAIEAMNFSKYLSNLSKEASDIHTPASWGISPIKAIKDSAQSKTIAARLATKTDEVGKLLEEARIVNNIDDIDNLERTYAIGKRFQEFYNDAANMGAKKAVEKLNKSSADDKLWDIVKGFLAKQTDVGDMEKTVGALKIKGGFLQPKIIPSELISVFDPQYSASKILNSYSDIGRELGILDGMATMALKNPSRINKITEVMDDATRTLLDIPEGETQVIFKGIRDYFPNLYGTSEEAKFLRGMINEQDAIYRKAVSAIGLDKAYPIFKNIKLRSIPSILRNFISEYMFRGAHHGIGFDDYFSTVKDVNKLYRGQSLRNLPKFKNLSDKDYKLVENTYYGLIGGNTSSLMDNIKKFATIKPNEAIAKGLSKAQTSQLKQSANTIWNYMGNAFRSSDDALRIKMFEKGLQQAAPGVDMVTALKNPDSVRSAYQFMRENVINYDNLPAVAQTIKILQPFFSFSWRAPRQYAKAFMKNPAFAARVKMAPELVSRHNMRRDGDSTFSNMWENRKNPVATTLTPFGKGDVFIAKNNSAGTISSLSLSAYDLWSSRPGKNVYAASDFDNVMASLKEITGLTGGTPAGTIMDVFNSVGEDGWQEQAISDLVRTATPAQIDQFMKILLANKSLQESSRKDTLPGEAARFVKSIYSPGYYPTMPEAALKNFGISGRHMAMKDFYSELDKAIQKKKSRPAYKVKKMLETYRTPEEEMPEIDTAVLEKQYKKLPAYIEKMAGSIQ